MKVLLNILFALLPILIYSQPIDFPYRDSILNKRSFHANSLNTYSSNALNNAFLNKFIYGGHISTDLLNDNLPKAFNVLGGEAEQTFSYFEGSFFKSFPNIGLTFSISDQHFASTSYKPDLFNTIFRGNEPYLGDTLNFSYTNFQYIHYQNYAIGLYDKRTQSYIRLGFLTGNNSLNFRTGETYFNTTNSGDKLFLETDFDGHMTRNDSGSTYFSAEGYGFALELNHNFIITTRSENKHVVNFNLSNLGSIFWNNHTQSWRKDSTYTFEGFDYQDIQNISNNSMEDVLDTLEINSSYGVKRESLPIQVIINKVPIYSLTQKWQSTFGFKAILIPDYRPMVYGGVYYQPTPYFSLTTRALFGGYGEFRLGINANLWIKDNVFLGLGTLDLIGLSSNTAGKGKSINLSLQINL